MGKLKSSVLAADKRKAVDLVARYFKNLAAITIECNLIATSHPPLLQRKLNNWRAEAVAFGDSLLIGLIFDGLIGSLIGMGVPEAEIHTKVEEAILWARESRPTAHAIGNKRN